MATVRLKPGHVQPVWAGHPWVYAQAIDRVEGGATRGDEVKVLDPRGNFLGRGFFSPGSAIPVRVLSRDPETPFDTGFFRDKIARALSLRTDMGLGGADTNGYRLIHAEGDGLPGLIVDRFDDVLGILLRIPVPPFRDMRLGEPPAQHGDIPGLDIAEMVAGSVLSHRHQAFRR